MKGKKQLEIEDVSVLFYEQNPWRRRRETLQVLHHLSLDLRQKEVLAVVGASGSGKSVLAQTILQLLPQNAVCEGRMAYQGQLLTQKSIKQWLGKKITYIPQSISYLDPLMPVGKQVKGVFGTKTRQKELFRAFHLSEKIEKKYPGELSGGMARSVLVAGATMEQPDIMIADEPTVGLHAEVATETMNRFREAADAGAGVLLITHDLEQALPIADRIAFFYAGSIVEIVNVEDVQAFGDKLQHPFSQAFYRALPQNGFVPLEGTQPYAGALPEGCAFAPRCRYRTRRCTEQSVFPLQKVGDGLVGCIHPEKRLS